MTPILHLGFAKAASTTVQEIIFASHPDVETETDRTDAVQQVRDVITRLRYDELRQPIQPLTPASATSAVHSHLYINAQNWAWATSCNAEAAATYLQRAFPTAKTVLVIREQREYLASYYLHEVMCGRFPKSASIDQFVDATCFRGTSALLYALDYGSKVRILEQVFGRDNVVVLPYELLRQSFDGFCATLFDGLGLAHLERAAMKRPAEASGADSSQMMARANVIGYWRTRLGVLPNVRLGRFVPSGLYRGVYARLVPRYEPRISDATWQEMREEFQPGNQWLTAHRGLDLGRFGYVL